MSVPAVIQFRPASNPVTGPDSAQQNNLPLCLRRVAAADDRTSPGQHQMSGTRSHSTPHQHPQPTPASEKVLREITD